jgi:predicted RNase H-like HicB family nuclease
MQITVQFMAKLPITLTKKPKWHVASCPILDVYSQGDTAEKAKHNLGEALSLFFISCFERGTLDAVLKSCGFKAVRPGPNLGIESAVHKGDYIDVPIPFLVDRDQDCERACHA